ncbi:MAG: hypothetical protein ABI548_15180 [Polyangiaceae bacterium]
MKPLDALRALGPGSEPPVEVKQRAAGMLFAALEAAAVVSVLSKPPAPASVHSAQASSLAGMSGSKIVAVAAGIWLAGGVTGAALYRALLPAEVRVVYVERPAAPITATAPSTLEPTVGASAPSAPRGPASIAALGRASIELARGGAGSDSGSELARERALLDVARADAAHGEPRQALAVTEQHRQQFPQGRLTEEREALAIRALLSLGRAADARARAQTFRSRYPNSFLIPAIESALSDP